MPAYQTCSVCDQVSLTISRTNKYWEPCADGCGVTDGFQLRQLSHRGHEEDGDWDWEHFVETQPFLGFGVWNFGQMVVYYMWGFCLISKCSVWMHFLFPPDLYTWFLHYSSQDYDPLTFFSAYKQLSFWWLEDSQCAFPPSLLLLPTECVHPLPCIWILKMHWFQIHLVPKVLKSWIHPRSWPIWFCIYCDSVVIKYLRPFAWKLPFLSTQRPNLVQG